MTDLKESTKPIGWTEIQLYDGKKLETAKRLLAEGRKAEGELLLLQARKPIFVGNKLWRAVKQATGIDLKIEGLTGMNTLNPLVMNLVPTRGKRKIAELVNGVDTTPVTAIAIGIGTTAAAAGDTALVSESTTNGAQRGAATATNQTTTTTGDTARWVKTFNLTGTFAITEEGLFDNNTSGGVMLARQVFSAINVVNGDSLQVTHNVQFT